VREFRYSDTSATLDDELISDLREHAVSKEAEHESPTVDDLIRSGTIEAALRETPLDKVRKVIEKKKLPPQQALKRHEVATKMAEMASRRMDAVAKFLGRED
jgi:hypothetical protein